MIFQRGDSAQGLSLTPGLHDGQCEASSLWVSLCVPLTEPPAYSVSYSHCPPGKGVSLGHQAPATSPSLATDR